MPAGIKTEHRFGNSETFHSVVLVRHVAKNGRIAIRARLKRNDDSGAVVRITVADNGCGFQPADAERIFKPFFTTKDGVGTGLGLWVSRQLVERNGGTIRARSPLGGGTVFTLDLPAAPGKPEAAPSQVVRGSTLPQNTLQFS